MPSLVSEFIINPVLRQARRFSSGFSAEPESVENAPLPLIRNQTRMPRPAASGLALPSPSTSPSSLSTVAGWDIGDGEASPSTPGLPGHVVSSVDHGASGPLPASPSSEVVSETIPSSPEAAAAYERHTFLPEDDGMGPLRQRILAIQSQDIASEEKAGLMHELLMEGYTRSQIVFQSKLSPRQESPLSTSLSEQYRATRPMQTLNKFLNHIGEGFMPLKFPLREADLQPTYAPRVPLEDGQEQDGDVDEADDIEGRPLGCKHYRRNVKLQCATCERWYTCRFCHDLAEDHILPRKETKNMLCMLCGCAQRASDTCVKCGRPAARYYCGVCKLWNEDANKPIYHCNDCGICRVGQGLGKDFFHCNKCMACISIAVSTTHRCIERSTDCDCPICGDYMFSSPRQVVFMLCGHSIHRKCYEEHLKSSFKCPICNKSVVNMETQFRNYDIAIATQPMPPEFRYARAKIFCNDCSAKSQTAYHWLGLKCTVCDSYNTVQLQLLDMPDAGGEASREDLAADIQGEPTREPEPSGLQDLASREALAPSLLPWPRPLPGHRPGTSLGSHQDLPTFSPFLVPERLARSVSPIPGPGLAENALLHGPAAETDESGEEEEEEDALGFWGGDDHRSAGRSEGNGAQDDDGSECESDSGDECDSDADYDEGDDDDEEEEEVISLFGHR